MGLDTTAFDAALKSVYINRIREQLNTKTTALDMFTKADVENVQYEGKNMIWALHSSRNVGVKGVAESGLLPAAGKQGTKNLTVTPKYWEGQINITAQAMKHSKSDKGSFVRAMQFEQDGLVNDMSRQRNRAIATGFGRGVLAIINGAANNAQQTVDSPGGVAGTDNPTRFLKVGMVVAIVAASDGTVRGVQTINTIDSTTQFTMDGAINASDNDYVTLGAVVGSTKEGSWGTEPEGLLSLIDGTTYKSSVHGLDRSQAANAFFKSTVLGSIGNLSEDVVQRGKDNAEEISGELITDFFAHVSIRREINKLYSADRRYNVAPGSGGKSFDPGSDVSKAKITLCDTPVTVDKDAPYGTLLGVCKPHMIWVPEVEGEWAQEDGKVLLRDANTDSYTGRFRVFEQLVSDKGNTHFRMDGINATVSAGTVAD